MEIENYKPNSHKSKEAAQSPPEKKVQKAVAKAKIAKKSGVQKIAEAFVSEDIDNVKSYIFLEVIVPAIKDTISKIVTNGIDMFLYGETGHTRKTGDRTSYNKYYDDSNRKRSNQPRRRTSDYNDIVIETRGEAEDVLDSMDELIDKYGTVSVSDLNDLVGRSGEFTDCDYGWTDIRNAQVIRVRDGYKLKLPRALPLD